MTQPSGYWTDHPVSWRYNDDEEEVEVTYLPPPPPPMKPDYHHMYPNDYSKVAGTL